MVTEAATAPATVVVARAVTAVARVVTAVATVARVVTVVARAVTAAARAATVVARVATAVVARAATAVARAVTVVVARVATVASRVGTRVEVTRVGSGARALALTLADVQVAKTRALTVPRVVSLLVFCVLRRPSDSVLYFSSSRLIFLCAYSASVSWSIRRFAYLVSRARHSRRGLKCAIPSLLAILECLTRKQVTAVSRATVATAVHILHPLRDGANMQASSRADRATASTKLTRLVSLPPLKWRSDTSSFMYLKTHV